MALSRRLRHLQFILSPLPAWCSFVTHLELCRLALYWVCALFCVLAGSVPPVQLLMSRLTYLRFSEKASDEESELFLVTGVWIFRWIRRLGDASQCRVLVLMVVLLSYSLAGVRALWTTSGDHPVPVFLQVWFRLQAVHESVWWSLWAL